MESKAAGLIEILGRLVATEVGQKDGRLDRERLVSQYKVYHGEEE